VSRHLVILLGLVLACRRPGTPEPIRFCREEVWLSVRPGTLEVRATYHFTVRARQPLGAVISYPFSIDSTCRYPDSVDIAGYRLTRNDSAATFTMHFQPGREDSFSAYYRQLLLGRNARYIVMTTRKWREPIDTARFRVTAPAEFAELELSYDPDSVVRRESLVDYYFTRRRFWPDRDVVVNW
jgi:hypothetical protein